MKKIYIHLPAILLLIAASCTGKTETNVMGYEPIYGTTEETDIKNLATLPNMINSGKIYLKDNYFFQIESGKGVHVFDITEKSNPTRVAYIQVPGAQEISIKNQNMYINSLNDLAIIDISNIDAVKEKYRLEDAFHIVNDQYPPERGYFECVDEKKGKVIGWELTELKNPKCKF